MPDMVKSISEIFANQVFRVPDYQRGYSWEEKQWNDLVEDLELLPEGRNHFTGTLVLRTSTDGSNRVIDAKGMAYSGFDIIDGQQRLTTFVILLKAIHDQMFSISEFHSLADGLQDLYLHNLDLNGQPFTKLTLNQDCQSYFADNVLELHTIISGPTIQSHKRLKQAKKYFDDFLALKKEDLLGEFPTWLQSLYFKLVHQLTLIVYPVDNELDAGVIFETMNDRGKPLTELELVKNYLLYVSSKLELNSAHDLNLRINSTWSHIYESLMAAGLGSRQYEDQLLRSHWLMAYDYDSRHWQNNRSIKKRFSLRRFQERHEELLQDLIDYLESLRNAVTAYCDIRAPELHSAFNDILDPKLHQQVVIWSRKLARLGARASFLPLLMAVRVQSEDEGEIYLSIARLCEIFDFRVYQWLRYRSNAGESRLYRLGNHYFNSPDPQRLHQDLARAILEYCTDNRFEERFSSDTENWYRWGGITYFLYEYEHHLAGGRPVQISYEAIGSRPKADSVEHILPQTASHQYWQDRFSPEQLERWTHDIGNLTLTFDNSSLSNHSFPAKKGEPGQIGRYAGSPLFVERQISVYRDWTEEEIIERRREIKEWTLDRWHVEQPPPIPSLDETGIERMMAIAEQNGIGEAFDAIHNAALKFNLSARVQKSIQYRPPFDYSLSVMRVEIHPRGFWIYFRLHNFAKFPGVTQDQVDEIFPYKNREWKWISPDDSSELVAALEKLAELIHEKKPDIDVTQPKKSSEDHFIKRADKLGLGEEFRALLEAHKKYPMHELIHSKWDGIKFTAMARKTEQLIWISPNLYYSIDYGNFERFFGIPKDQVKEILGELASRTLDKSEVLDVIERLDKLFAEIENSG